MSPAWACTRAALAREFDGQSTTEVDPVPLFEVEGDRPQIVRGAGPSDGTTAHRVVDSHIDGLLGEQIFPVCSGTGPGEPHLLALDASGAPVVVELVSTLTDDDLNRALDHAGAAGRMTRGQLAARYQAGAQAFARDVAEFYDSVPVTRTQPGRPGVRLIIICQNADEDVLNAIDFLRQPSMPVEVLRLGVVRAEDGRRFVDVSPLVIHPASPPDRPALAAGVDGRTPPVAPSRPGIVVEQPGLAAPAFLRSATLATPVVAPARSVGRRSRADRFTSPNDSAATESAAPDASARDTSPAPDVGYRPHGFDEHEPAAPSPRTSDELYSPLDRPAQDWDTGAGQGRSAAPMPEPAPWDLPYETSYETQRESDPLDLAAPPVPSDPLSADPWWAHGTTTASTPMVLDEDADADLAALAATLGVPTALVWERRRRGQRYEAVLHPDGTIELADGGRYRHPDVAASAASGSYTADGWSVWRLYHSGETLVEAFRVRCG